MLLGTPGCSKQKKDLSNPGESHDMRQAEEAELENTYRSKEDADEADEEDGDEGDEASEEKFGAVEAAKIAETAADDAVEDAYAPRLMTPAMPASWPPTGGKVVYYVYPLEPLPKGVDNYTVKSASLRIVLDLVEKKATAEKLSGSKELGAIERGRDMSVDDPMHGAEQALFECANGIKTADDYKYLLKRYEVWFKNHSVIANDLRKRAPDFIGFVENVK